MPSLPPPRKVFVVGVGMTKFEKPGKRTDDYYAWAKEAGTKALQDARISFNQVEQACVSYVYGDTTSGQRCVYELGMTGIPVYNVNNACSSGSTALYMGRQFIEGGIADCILALGFEKMEKGSLSAKYMDRTNPMDKHLDVMMNTFGMEPSPITAQMFGNAGIEHMKKYGTTADHFAKIAYKNHKHSISNPYAQFQQNYTLDEIRNSKMIHAPLTKLQCSPTSDGAAAVVLASEEFVRKHGLEAQAVEIVAQQMVTDFPSTFEGSAMKLVGYDMSKRAAEIVYQKSGCRPTDVDVVELHDCFSTNELLTYEALGLCGPGEGGAMVDRGDNTYGGKYVVNPSGGLESKGHPLGATGLAQCSELYWQLRGLAERRQVPGAKLALQHNIGLGGAVVVTLYRLGFPAATRTPSTAPSSLGRTEFKVARAFNEIDAVLKQDGAAIVKNIKAVFAFQVKNEAGKEGNWVVDCRNGQGSVEFNSSKKGDCTFIAKDDDLERIMNGKLDAQRAFMQGKLKIKGNIGVAMKLKELQGKGRAVAQPASAGAQSDFKVTPVFKLIEEMLKEDGDKLTKKIKAVYSFQVKNMSGQQATWLVDVKNAPGSVQFNSDGKADCTFIMADEDLLSLMAGTLNPQKAFMQGKLKIRGNVGLAMKLNELKPKAGLAAAPASAGNQEDFKVAPIFKEIEIALKEDGANIVKKIKGVYSFKVKSSSGKEVNWIVDCKNGNGCVEFGSSKKADCTFIMGDNDLLSLMTGKMNAQKAFMQGKLKITGNMALAMKLKELQPKQVKAKL